MSQYPAVIDWQPKDSDGYAGPRYYVAQASWTPHGYVAFHCHDHGAYSVLDPVPPAGHDCDWALSDEPFLDNGSGDRSVEYSSYECTICHRKSIWAYGKWLWLGESSRIE